MDRSYRYPQRFTIRHLLIGLAGWWLVMTAGYFAIVVWADARSVDGSETGARLAGRFADQLSVPLLDRDFATMRAVLNKALANPGVLFASVFDHEKNPVAMAGIEDIFNAVDHPPGAGKSLSSWEGAFPDAHSWIGFQSPIYFAEVPIGRLQLYLSDTRSSQPRMLFALVAPLSLLLIVVPFLASRFRIVRAEEGGQNKTAGAVAAFAARPPEPAVRCPLCGSLQPVSDSVFGKNGHRRRQTANRSGRADRTLSGDIDLFRSSNHQDLYQIRKKVILRCAEIIQKLTA